MIALRPRDQHVWDETRDQYLMRPRPRTITVRPRPKPRPKKWSRNNFVQPQRVLCELKSPVMSMGRGLRPLFWGGLGPHLTWSHLGWGLSQCQVPSWYIQPFGHNKHGRKLFGGGALPPFGEGKRGPHITQSRLAERGIPPYQVASWSMQPFGCNRYGPKAGVGLCPFGGGGAGFHLTQCGQGRVLPACQVSSWSVQPYGHSAPTLQTDRQTGQRSDSIGRIVLQMVAQKVQEKKTIIGTRYFIWLPVVNTVGVMVSNNWQLAWHSHSSSGGPWTHWTTLCMHSIEAILTSKPNIHK